MAKSGLWLAGAKGKLNEVVMQKGENGTIMRKLVTPANPQTIKQMQQRIAFGTSATAAKLLLPIIGQSFQGMSKEKLNRREFMRINMNMLRQAAIGQTGTEQTDFKFGFNPKNGAIYVVPNPYIISNGTLSAPAVSYTTAEDGDESDVTVLSGVRFNTPALASLGTVTPEQLLQAVFGITAGDQLTFVAIANNLTTMGLMYDFSENGNAELPAQELDYLRETSLVARRLVTQESDGTTITVTDTTTAAELIAHMMLAINTAKTSASVLNVINAMTVNAGAFGTDATLRSLFGLSVNYLVLSVGAFTSRYESGLWKYSFCQMTNTLSQGDRAEGEPGNARWGLDANGAILSYLGIGTVSSNLYTRQGNEVGNNIGSF